MTAKRRLSVTNALLDLGASVNIIPLAILKKKVIKSTKMTLKLVDQVTKYPYGVVADVLVKVDKLTFPVDFVVMDMKEDEEVPLILGRPFMKTARIIVDVDKGELQVRTQDEEVTLNLFYGLQNFNAGEECVQKDGSKRYSTLK